MSQNELILAHLRKRKFITTWDAFSRYGITRLSGRIYDLRDQGHRITTTYVTNRRTKVRYGKYRLEAA